MHLFEVSYAAAAGAGILTFLSPCILPLVPAYLCFISGLKFNELTAANRDGRSGRAVLGGVAFALGLGTVFVAMGAAATSLGQMLAAWREPLAMAGGALVIAFGLHTMGLVTISPFNAEKRLEVTRKPASVLGAYAVGLAFGLGWTPCVGPVLGTILMIAGSGEDVWYGASLLAVFAAGLGVPFVIAAMAAEKFVTFLHRIGHHLRYVEIGMGVMLVATGLLLLTGGVPEITAWLLRAAPILAGTPG